MTCPPAINQARVKRPEGVEKRQAITPARRKRILEAYDNKCAICKTGDGPYEIDHWHPLILGGKNDDSNLRPLCVPCHKEATRDTVSRAAKVNRLLGLTKKRQYFWPKRPFGIPGLRKKLNGGVVKT